MEHRKKGRKLNRTASHRKALFMNLCISLIKHKRITTTLAKAKDLRLYVEPLLTKAKNAAKNPELYVHYAREIRKFLKDKEAINILLKEVGPKLLNRNGGYTRVLKSGFRLGDGGERGIIELVDFGIADKAKTETGKTAAKAPAKKTVAKKVKTDAVDEKKSDKPAKKTAVKKTKAVKEEKPVKKTAAKKTVTKKKKED
ncbi:MAG: 50S ribosomal protein L17 [Ignavibacteriota bacterium]